MYMVGTSSFWLPGQHGDQVVVQDAVIVPSIQGSRAFILAHGGTWWHMVAHGGTWWHAATPFDSPLLPSHVRRLKVVSNQAIAVAYFAYQPQNRHLRLLRR